MARRQGIRRKLAISITASLAVSLGLLGAVVVTQLMSITREKIHNEATSAVHLRSSRIATFFSENARVVTTMLTNRQMLEWFEGYNEYRRPLAGDEGFRLVTSAFGNIVGTEPNVVSAFFATESTGEYFKPAGRVEREGYNPKERPWWRESVERNRLFVARPLVDASTKKLSVSIETTVRRTDGRLLGVAGIDFLLSTVEDLVADLSFEGQGLSFLIEDGGRIVAFPGADLDREQMIETRLGSLDGSVPDCAGFAALEERMRAGEEGSAPVRFRGEPYVAYFSPVRSDKPAMSWSLGLLVPRALVAGPVRQVTLASLAGVLAVIGAIGGLMLLVTSAIVTRPIGRLLERFRDVVSGTGDLTRRVEVSSDDEIGELASLFNAFLERIQQDIATIARLAATLTNAASGLNGFSQQIAGATEETSAQAGVVSAAAEQISSNVSSVATGSEQMGSSIREIARSAHHAAEVASQAVGIARSTSERFVDLQGSSERIGHVVKMIRAVAEQTNLLALNATIEAARAGEAGRGFAVVAGEVKELANQTSRATAEIAELIQTIATHTETAGGAVGQVTDIIHQINEIQTLIASAVEEQSCTTSEIGRSVSEAARGTVEIASSIASLADAARATASDAASIQGSARELAQTAEQLHAIVRRFTY